MDDVHADNHQRVCTGNAVGTLLTAVDLGSNSFYLMQGRMTDDHLTVTRRLREGVRLVAGIDRTGILNPERQARALQCLDQFGEITRGLPANSVRVVATSAVRRLAQPQHFLERASAALGQPISVIDGYEEGELIWLGAIGTLPSSDESRLVIDIGGGSTECIIGRGQYTRHIASIDVGCIVVCTQFFADGIITATRWQQAQNALCDAIGAQRGALAAHGWQQVWGSSGSACGIGAIVQALGTSRDGITTDAVVDLRQRLLQAGHIDRLQLPELKTPSSQVIAGTVAVLEALFATLAIERMALCTSAMREGIIRQLASTV